MTEFNNIAGEGLTVGSQKFNGLENVNRRLPSRVPDFQDPKFLEMADQKARFVLSRVAFREVRKQFFETGELESDIDVRDVSGLNDNYLNVPVYDYLSFRGGKYKDLEGNDIEFGGGVTNELIITPVIISCSQSKNIVETQIQGRSGSVNEFIGNGDLMFTVRGILVSEDNKYPAQEVRILREILEAETELEVVSDFISYMVNAGEYSIIIKSWSMPQRRGYRNTQEFEITMAIDRPLTITTQNLLRG